MMDDLIFLAHRIPYPPNKGDKIRSWHMLKYLAARYRVHLGCFIDDPQDQQHKGALEAICASTCFVDLPVWKGRLRSVTAFVRNEPLSVAHYRDAGLTQWVEHVAAQHNPKGAVLYSSQTALFLPPLVHAGARTVMDFVDVDSDKWAQYAARKSGPLKWLYAREANRLAHFEKAVAQQVDACVLVSDQEAALFRTIVPAAADKIFGMSNGVDTEAFSPDRRFENPFSSGEQAVVFTGAMDYWPNVDAVVWFADHVWPKVIKACPQAVFYIVGFKPAAEVQALAGRPGLVVTGAVSDTKDYLAHAACAVAPLRVARGIQNKVLEAMAMALPVVASPQAAEGLAHVKEAELAVADQPDTMAKAVIAVLTSTGGPDGAAARNRVMRDYAWEANLAVLDQLIAG
ncbi:MAG: TIGR03087 family PEP-CTERM/XrtA system glycosyltransferase [Alphaproteobacteria bacterium]